MDILFILTRVREKQVNLLLSERKSKKQKDNETVLLSTMDC